MAKDIEKMKKINWPKWILVLCLSLGAFLRLWNFPNTLQFLGDQGRDAITAKEILIDHNPVLIGPVTSTGNMYLGPLYYYFMVPFLAVTYPNPIGPAYAIAGLSIITIGLIYFLGKELVGEKAALTATILVCFSSTLVYFGRFSWNPNPAPLVAVILIWATYRAVTKKAWYWVIVSLCIAILVQLHYITLLCIPAAGLIWLYSLRENILAVNRSASTKNKLLLQSFFGYSVIAVALLLLSFAPLVLFDLRHQFINFHAFQHFITADLGPNQATLIDRVHLILIRTFLRTNQTLFQQLAGQNIWISTLGVVAFVVGLVAEIRPRCLRLWSSLMHER